MRYLEEAKELGIRGYEQRPGEDVLIARWWEELGTSGELETIFSESCKSLGNFYSVFKPPNFMFYCQDSRGISLALWAAPFLSAFSIGIWLAPRVRLDTTAYRAVQLIFHTLFQGYPLSVGITKVRKLLTTFEYVGYNVIGEIPGLIDGKPTWIVSMTREEFQNSRLNPANFDPRRTHNGWSSR